MYIYVYTSNLKIWGLRLYFYSKNCDPCDGVLVATYLLCIQRVLEKSVMYKEGPRNRFVMYTNGPRNRFVMYTKGPRNRFVMYHATRHDKPYVY